MGSARRVRSVLVGAWAGADMRADVREGVRASVPHANAGKKAEVVVLGSDTNRCAVGWGRGWGQVQELRRVQVQEQVQVQVQGAGQSPESIPASRLARGAPPREQEPVAQAAQFRTPLGGRTNVGRKYRGDFQHTLRVTRVRARGDGESDPYHSRCLGEAVAQVAHNPLDNVVYVY